MPNIQSLQVIVPCFNPPQGWENALARRFSEFQKLVSDLGIAATLTVVNDGSERNVSPENWQRLAAAIPGVQAVSYPQNRGKGFALRQGVAATNADFYLLTDADFPYTLESMCRVVETLRCKGGIAAGNRDTGYYVDVPFFRKVLSQILRWLLLRVIRLPVSDSQCGLKGFDNAGREVFLRTTIDRFLFDLEFLMLAERNKIPVSPVPVQLREGVVFSKVGWKVLVVEGGNFLKLLAFKTVWRG